jgi:hypothetical protein
MWFGEYAEGVVGFVAVMFLQGLTVDELQFEEDVEDEIDGDRGDGDDETPAGFEEADAAIGEGEVEVSGKMFEDGEHDDDVEGAGIRGDVLGKITADHAESLTAGVGRGEVGIDAEGTGAAASEGIEKGAIKGAEVEDAVTGLDMG